VFEHSFSVKDQRGLSEAQNGYGFGMLPRHGPRDVQFSSLEKAAKGVPKWVKIQPPPNLSFNIQYQLATYKKYIDGVLGVKRRVVGSK